MPTIEQARAWYTENDPVHGFDHILRVYHIARRLALEEGADLEIVSAAALLHDAADPVRPLEQMQSGEPSGRASRSDHHQTSAGFARRLLAQEGWDEERIRAVEHCIRAHRFRDNTQQPQTLEAQVLFDADKLDAIGAVGVARAIAYAALAGQPAYAPPSAHFRNSNKKESGEPHSAYHEFVYKLSRLKDRMYTSSGRRAAAERHQFMAQFFHKLEDEMQNSLTMNEVP